MCEVREGRDNSESYFLSGQVLCVESDDSLGWVDVCQTRVFLYLLVEIVNF